MTTEPPPPRPPDHPIVPRRGPRSIFAGILLGLGVLLVGGYAAFAYTEREIGGPEHNTIPAGVRSAHGGYRSYHFWHSGYHGGK
jgi:hypothetical protein